MTYQPKLQIAFDAFPDGNGGFVSDLDRAVRIINELRQSLDGAILEVGTPLAKTYGAKTAVQAFRFAAPDNEILLDGKAWDVGSLEAAIAKQAGAQSATVLGATCEETVYEFVKYCLDNGLIPGVDLSQTTPEQRSNLMGVGSEVRIYEHVLIDNKKKAGQYDALPQIRAQHKGPIGVAGSLNEERIIEVAKFQPDIYVVGGAITNPEGRTPLEALRAIKKAIQESRDLAA